MSEPTQEKVQEVNVVIKVAVATKATAKRIVESEMNWMYDKRIVSKRIVEK